MSTIRNHVFLGCRNARRINVFVALFFVAFSAHATLVSTDPVTGGRTYRFTPDDADFVLFSTTWNDRASYYFHDDDVYEFEESDSPYVFTRKVSQGNHPRITYRGVKADGSPANPAKVVFLPDSDTANYRIEAGSASNTIENITFSNIHFFANSDFNVISNCVFTGMKNEAAIYGQFAYNGNSNYVKPGWSACATDCRFENATCSVPGAVRYLYTFAATNCVFSGNVNNDGNINGGGAIGMVGNLSCRDCSFTDNETTGMYGGAIHLSHDGTIALDRCVFSGNHANQTYNRNDSCGGGALSVTAAMSGYIRNCLFAGNSISTEIGKNSYDGGAIRIYNASANIAIENCTFAGNTVSVGGTNKDVGGALAATLGSIGVTNCIFYANHGMLGSTSWKTSHFSVADWSLVANCLEANFEKDGTSYDFSTIDTDGTPSTHIVDGVNGNKVGNYDPKFTDATNGDYTLQKGSPCRDAGALLAWMTDGSLDLGGNARVFGSAPDMGCYEWWQKSGLSIFVR